MKKIFVVMPVYNEEDSIKKVLDEWINALRRTGIPYVLCILNDGSKDSTLNILKEYSKNFPELMVVDKQNSGHGQTCIQGYRMALKSDVDWVFQIDSDGQCDPLFFPGFLEEANKEKAIFGWRKTRADGLRRVIISKFVRFFVFFSTGKWIKDSNVPYRLIHCDILKDVVSKVPEDFNLANICISVLIAKRTKILWLPIHFRDRIGGSPSVKTFSFIKHGVTLFRQLKKL